MYVYKIILKLKMALFRGLTVVSNIKLLLNWKYVFIACASTSLYAYDIPMYLHN